jgi:Protein of unknown function (DUF3182)
MTSNSATDARLAAAERGVVVYRDAARRRAAHDEATCVAIARGLADIKGCAFAGEFDPKASYSPPPYFVPTDTVVGVEHARSLGIEGENDLFGGVAPHAFVATKCISHPLVDDRARAPEGWSEAFGRRVRNAVLEGYSAFSTDDAMRAGLRLFVHGRVRVKRALGIGGCGQTVVADAPSLEHALADADGDEVSRYGIALEQDLTDVTTHSIGQVRVDDLVASYYGTQRLTQNNHGEQMYGGSDLLIARGGYDALLSLNPSPSTLRAIEQARLYDEAAFACFPGLVASRRNYDVAEGTDGAGERRCGVLEQSWRIGGASSAEVAALAAFRDDPSLNVVRACSTELYGANASPPADATVYFEGVDERAGPLTKYVRLFRDVHA